MGSKKKAKRKAPVKKAAIKKRSSKKPQTRKSSLTLVNFKCAGKDLKAILANAKKHAGGNYSAWLRHAALHFKPKKGEVIR